LANKSVIKFRKHKLTNKSYFTLNCSLEVDCCYYVAYFSLSCAYGPVDDLEIVYTKPYRYILLKRVIYIWMHQSKLLN